MSYPPKQAETSQDVQAEYTQLLTRTGALFYSIKAAKSNLEALEAQLVECEAQRSTLEARYKGALAREQAEKEAESHAVAPEST